ncbi:hypothetical protein OH809_42860 [Streptomyces sp. NBC_00873]|uniref:hypothetical protein n=1 Tax=unclassified Streptomyces TaxID=2593676 RepID=UPI00386D83AF|nr:hypothetical protein OH809_00850 [Streptomyces sp. NBC_00873]WSY97454.1 hypothetical protein OH809_42860 [Streptomyces sp. NBC_00873]WTA49087.1 hypothetical protein OH821_00845 [Streptomyces sp. NBC_00842]WTA49125.1 hypothetical protein OH821_42970 [Streptomyces sp. NBC_00842]
MAARDATRPRSRPARRALRPQALTQYGVSAWDVRHGVCTAAGLVLLVVFAPRLLRALTAGA